MVGKEGGGGLIRQVDIAPAHLSAGDDQLAPDAHGQVVAEGVHHSEHRVGDGRADGNDLAARHFLGGAAHGGLRGAVNVEDHAVLTQLPKPVIEPGGEGFRADVEEGELTDGLPGFGNIQQTQKIGGCTGDAGDAPLPDQPGQQLGGVDFLFRGDDHGVSVAQRHEFLHHRHVEGEGGQGQAHPARRGVMHDLQGFFVPVDVVGDVAVRDHHALGPARGADGRG